VATIRAFRALRPPVATVARVAAPPYDVINTAEARALAAGNADSFLHVSRPEIDLPEGTDDHADEVYAQGATNLRQLVAQSALIQDEVASLYVYTQQMGEHRQSGLVACASVTDYDRDIIKKHEKTRQDKEDDRTRHIDVLGAHDEPVFLTYRARPDIDAEIARAQGTPPTYDFATDDGVQHTLWIVPANQTRRLIELFAAVDTLYVADGHHRSASASRVHALRHGKPGEHDIFLAVIFPHDQMQILAYNRVVRDPQERSPEALLQLFREQFDVEEATSAIPTEPRTFGLYLRGRWWSLRARSGSFPADDPVASLDASICQDQILEPLFGVTDPRRDKNVDFVGGIRGVAELEKRVDEQNWTVALHLYPTSIDQLMAVSDAGRLMPPKSTWFEPKLRSGLFVHAF
jgi:uncharacterized protein (DUF1015 family)